MNRKQRACLVAGFLLLVAAGLVPPWRYGWGYGFLFAYRGGATLDLPRLFVEWALIVFATGGLFFWFGRSNDGEAESKTDTISISRTKWRLGFSLLCLLGASAIGLSFYGYNTQKRVRRLEAAVHDARGILDSNASLPDFIPDAGQLPDCVLPPPAGAVPIQEGNIPPAPVGKLRPICRTNEAIQANYKSTVAFWQKVVDEKIEALKHARGTLDKSE